MTLGARHISIDAGAMYLVHKCSMSLFSAMQSAFVGREWVNESQLSQEDFDNILEYSDMCDSSRSALLAKNHGQEAIDDFMELNDDLSDFEEAYMGHWDSDREAATTECA